MCVIFEKCCPPWLENEIISCQTLRKQIERSLAVRTLSDACSVEVERGVDWCFRQAVFFDGDLPPKANHEQWNDDRSILFHSCFDQMKYCKVQHQQLTLRQFVPLPMHGWNWPVLEMFRISGTCLSHHTRITAMHACDSPLTNIGMVPNRLTASFFNTMRCKTGVPSCLQNLDLTFGVKAESNIAYSFEDSWSSTPVETLLHCCIRLDVEKGGSSDRSPTG